jgi:hypothetical protein
LTITNRPCGPHITELSLLFQIFQLNPRSDSFQQQICQQIPHINIVAAIITKYKSILVTASPRQLSKTRLIKEIFGNKRTPQQTSLPQNPIA